MAKKAAATVGDRRYQQAVDLFERAVKALGRKDFDRARDLLDALLSTHADRYRRPPTVAGTGEESRG